MAAPFATRAGGRAGRWLAAGELLAVVLLFVADAYHLVPLTKTPFLLLLGWISLRLRGLGWSSVGLSRERGWRLPLAAGIAGGIGIESFELFVSQPILVWLTGEYPDLSDFKPLAGNLALLMIALALAWILAALGEELVWRGYLLNRLAGLGSWPAGRAAWAAGLVLVSVAFGIAHAGQGPTGMIENAVDGLILGLIYFGTGRNLWAPIIAHGITTIDLLLIFLGRYPGL